jgi:hypothetical protein
MKEINDYYKINKNVYAPNDVFNLGQTSRKMSNDCRRLKKTEVEIKKTAKILTKGECGA